MVAILLNAQNVREAVQAAGDEFTRGPVPAKIVSSVRSGLEPFALIGLTAAVIGTAGAIYSAKGSFRSNPMDTKTKTIATLAAIAGLIALAGAAMADDGPVLLPSEPTPPSPPAGATPSAADPGLAGNQAARMNLQRQLAALGYYTDAIDGRWGNNSVAGMLAFQRASGLEPTGWPNAETLRALTAAQDARRAAEERQAVGGYYGGERGGLNGLDDGPGGRPPRRLPRAIRY